MACFPELDLNLVKPDPELARRVPYDLAMYYLALPLAQENGSVSVAMAHPENAAARATLHDLLRAEIVPLRGQSDTIRTAIKQVHQAKSPASARILTWSGSPDLAPVVRQTAAMVGNCLPTAVPVFDAGQATLATVLSAAGAAHPTLTIIAPPPGQPVDALLRDANAPLVLIRGPFRTPRQVLVVVRGFASDDILLELAAPVLRKLAARVVLLPLYDESARALDQFLCVDGPARQHLEGLLQRLEDEHITAALRVRSGNPVSQVVTELRQGDYDLLVIAAEASGQFVARVLEAADREKTHTGRPVFILKPTHGFQHRPGTDTNENSQPGVSAR